MSEKLIEAQDMILGRVNQVCRKLGLNNIMAQLYVILYFNDKPMSLNDMLDRLKISKGSVSVNIRALERYGAVRKVWVKNTRKDFYEAEMDIIKVIMERVKSMTRDRISEVRDTIDASYSAANSIDYSSKEEQQAVDIFKKKLDAIKKLQGKAQSIYGLLNSGILNSILFGKNHESKHNSNNKIELGV